MIHKIKEALLWSDRNDEKVKHLFKKYWKVILKDILIAAVLIAFLICFAQDMYKQVERSNRENEAILSGKMIY